ncbi:MAG: hypothetical protein KDA91_16590 [Planctomycetaceae bacterium]|nr:hypothetical protein [Planctomycetaceae bacterium]
MNKEDYRQWLAKRVITQTRLATVAVTIMGLGGAGAFMMEAFLVRWIITTGFISNGFLSWMITLGILGTVLFVTWLRVPGNIGDKQHTADIGETQLTLHVAPAMGAVWTFALGSIDSDQTWVERLLGLLALPQRMLCAAWYVFHRIQQLKELNIPGCAHVIRIVSRKAERVEVSEIAEKRKEDDDLPKTLREVSLIDGVVFLTRKTVGISLAPRLVDELNGWNSGSADD